MNRISLSAIVVLLACQPALAGVERRADRQASAHAAGDEPLGCAVIYPVDEKGAPQALAPVLPGARTIGVFIVDFADATVAGTMGLSDPVDHVAGVLFDDARTSAGVIEEASFGLNSLISDANLDGRHDIFQLSVTDTIRHGRCEPSVWASAADAAAEDMGIDLGLYQHRMYVVPQVSSDCWWGGLAQVGCTTWCRSWMRAKTATLFAHELGHNLGMHHASTDLDNDLVIDAEYGDLSDLMGSSSSWRQFNATHKHQMGWIPPEQVVDMFGGGPQTFTIAAAETHPALAGLPQIVRVSHPDRPNQPYYLSYRVPVGYDATMSSTYRYKLQIHTSALSSGRTLYVTGLTDGASFQDPVAYDLVIRQLSHDDSSVTFEVLRDEPDADGDGSGETVDCDEHDPTVYPGAPEICDHVDNDCDELVDEDLGPCDIDGDGFDELIDCNDGNATVYPGAPELCDWADNDCDGARDEPDYDGDGIGNCTDICPLDPTKSGGPTFQFPDGNYGFTWCPCGVPEDTDSDGDRVPDCADRCPDDPDHGVDDADRDGTPDCIDQCPNDPSKWNPTAFGNCPCGVPDDDTDRDRVYDCHDRCPGENDRIDGDIDGMPDCADLCPADPWKFEPGACGCGREEEDVDADAACDDVDNCRDVHNPAQTDGDLDGVGHACDCGPGDPDNAEVLDPASGLRFDSPAELAWQPPAHATAGPLTYDVLRSESAADLAGAICVTSGAVTTYAADDDVPDGVRFYLVRAVAPCGQNLGLGSDEARRTAPPCP